MGRTGGEVGDDECTPTRSGLAYHLRQDPISFTGTEEGQETNVRVHDQGVPHHNHLSATGLLTSWGGGGGGGGSTTDGGAGDNECTST